MMTHGAEALGFDDPGYEGSGASDRREGVGWRDFMAGFYGCHHCSWGFRGGLGFGFPTLSHG